MSTPGPLAAPKPLAAQADANFARHIAANPYPGRGIVAGRDGAGGWVLVYWIMGRSTNSRNRRFVADGGTLRTEPVDLSKVADPSLIIYEAMLELPRVQIVSNGDQTRTVHGALAEGRTFEDALATREREPDAPNYTPRITALLDLRAGAVPLRLSILRAGACDPAATDRAYFHVAPPAPGLGWCLTTYAGDGDPLPPFRGDPLLVPCRGTPQEILDAYWNALDDANRISLAVKSVDDGGATRALLVRNRHA